ncbi:hypothetical protein B0H63DRAFT_516840 [Podospora didyma]|uniref:Uncharacterized protein n=1 Tax=Podospora didyma TaxID=330526 RepID=A0AAE0U7B0_9PEZI|nr:hypothetical protein B0H63DRAFT_516840 [Podospora didyma]
MNADKPEDDPASLLVDILQEDQLGSDWEDLCTASPASPARSIKRLRIHVDMTSTQYLTPGAHHSERLHTEGPSTGAYTSADLDPYSAASGVSSFNYPATTDASLLTPVSSSGSPPLLQRPPAKSVRSYHSAQTAPGTQVPTPPNSSKMYYGYEMNPNSQSSSPMNTVHPQSTEAGHFDMTPYIAHSPPGGHHPSSPRAEIPPPIDPYLGSFTVSGPNEGEVAHHSFHDYHQFTGAELNHTSGYPFRPQHHVTVGTPHMHHRMPSNGGQAPILTQPHPSQFRPQTTPRIGGIEDLRDPSMLLGAYPSHPSLSPGRRVQPRKKPAPARKPARTPKTTPHVGSSEGQLDDDDKEELTLREDAPEDDKYLFQLRKEFISEKGKGMWEEMKAKYSEKHQGNWEKAALQMKVSRAVAKFGVWPKREIERLKEAHRYYEDKRYQLILARMKENGGCRVWDWKPQHVEAMLVKLGMEEATVDEKTGTRRRKNKAARRRASSQNGHHHNANVMNDWSNGLGLHPAFQGHAHHVGAPTRQPSFDMMSDDASIAPTFSSEQENDYLDHIFSKQVKPENSLSPEIMELSYEDDGVSRPPTRDLNHHSERVARQACEQMMQQQARVDHYGPQ